MRRAAQRRAGSGNEFIHFSIRAIVQAQVARKKGFMVRCIFEHPEDLGRTARVEPAAIWQLPQLREAFGSTPCVSVAGHQCQFPGVDRSKPTRLYSDILSIAQFGNAGWPRFDSRGWYLGPLPKSCGLRHKERMIGRRPDGGICTSPTAASPRDVPLFGYQDFRHLVGLDFPDLRRGFGQAASGFIEKGYICHFENCGYDDFIFFRSFFHKFRDLRQDRPQAKCRSP